MPLLWTCLTENHFLRQPVHIFGRQAHEGLGFSSLIIEAEYDLFFFHAISFQ